MFGGEFLWPEGAGRKIVGVIRFSVGFGWCLLRSWEISDDFFARCFDGLLIRAWLRDLVGGSKKGEFNSSWKNLNCFTISQQANRTRKHKFFFAKLLFPPQVSVNQVETLLSISDLLLAKEAISPQPDGTFPLKRKTLKYLIKISLNFYRARTCVLSFCS